MKAEGRCGIENRSGRRTPRCFAGAPSPRLAAHRFVAFFARPVNFGDQRLTYVDPLDEADAPSKKSGSGGKGKGSPLPDDVEPPSVGQDFLDGVVAPGGRALLGGGEEWLLPVHLVPGIYWLRP